MHEKMPLMALLTSHNQTHPKAFLSLNFNRVTESLKLRRVTINLKSQSFAIKIDHD